MHTHEGMRDRHMINRVDWRLRAEVGRVRPSSSMRPHLGSAPSSRIVASAPCRASRLHSDLRFASTRLPLVATTLCRLRRPSPRLRKPSGPLHSAPRCLFYQTCPYTSCKRLHRFRKVATGVHHHWRCKRRAVTANGDRPASCPGFR